jgi:hypothetical protein
LKNRYLEKECENCNFNKNNDVKDEIKKLKNVRNFKLDLILFNYRKWLKKII